jgi:hypothetical protein
MCFVTLVSVKSWYVKVGTQQKPQKTSVLLGVLIELFCHAASAIEMVQGTAMFTISP